jgi:DNA-binding LacI/PurR family transcriptional regulator
MKVPPDMPIYEAIKRELKNQIESGELPEGARVPSEFELARAYGVSRNPTRQALRDLELEGYLIRLPGRGSFVAPISQRQKLFKGNGLRTMAIACPGLEVRYSRTVIQGFAQRAAESNIHAMVYFLRFSGEAEYEFLADLRNSGIEGMAFWLQHTSESTLDLLQKFRRASFPFVLIDRYVRGLDADFVVTDNENVGYELTKALLGRGHKDIGLIMAPMDNTTTEDRFAGHRRALREAGVAYSDELLGFFANRADENSAVVHRIMAHCRRPTAFFCSNDGLAAQLIDAVVGLGYRVPEDVEVATVDDNDLAHAADVPIITASQRGYDMGRHSVDILLERISNPNLAAQQRFLKAELNFQQDSPVETGGSGS